MLPVLKMLVVDVACIGPNCALAVCEGTSKVARSARGNNAAEAVARVVGGAWHKQSDADRLIRQIGRAPGERMNAHIGVIDNRIVLM